MFSPLMTLQETKPPVLCQRQRQWLGTCLDQRIQVVALIPHQPRRGQILVLQRMAAEVLVTSLPSLCRNTLQVSGVFQELKSQVQQNV